MITAPPIRYARADDGANIAYWVHGSGPPLIFVPFPLGQVQARMMWEQEEHRRFYTTVGRHRTVVYCDARNSGLSSRHLPPDQLKPEHFALDITAVMDANGIESAGLYGVANAGRTALVVAGRHPERVSQLILVYGDASPRLSGLRVPGLGSLSLMAERHWDTFTELFATIVMGLDRAEYARWWSRVIREASSPEELLAGLELLRTWDASEYLESVNCPTLVIHPDEPIASRESALEIASRIPNANFVTTSVESQGVGWADPQALAELLSFLGADEELPPPRRPLLEGLKILLFTDLVGSTSMQSRLGDRAARDVLRAHDAAVRQAAREFDGSEVKHTGDGIMTTFGSAADAVNCALTVNRDIATYNDTHEGEELLVRFGLNAGEPIAEDDDLFGLSVTLAARIGNWGEPGQVLCSNVVRELLLGKGFEFASVGSAELKGLDEPAQLYEVTSR